MGNPPEKLEMAFRRSVAIVSSRLMEPEDTSKNTALLSEAAEDPFVSIAALAASATFLARWYAEAAGKSREEVIDELTAAVATAPTSRSGVRHQP